MANTVVIGAQWGDEAKGKIVDFLAVDADLVVRFNGGNNAGHTVVAGGESYKFHLVPCGVLHPNTICIMGDGQVIDPEGLIGELDGLVARGISVDCLQISPNAHVIMPYHKIQDRLEEEYKGKKAIGTTARGIGPAYADKASRIGIRIGELVNPVKFSEHLAENVRFKNALLTKVYGAEPVSEAEILEKYLACAERIRPFVANTNYTVHAAAKAGKKILFEGAQGALLDIDYGTYPYVTSSHTVSGAACLGTGVGPKAIDRIIGVTKAYNTRVGAGVFPTELTGATGEYIRERGHEYGTTTGRPRRCGWLDTVAVRYSVMVNGMTGLAVTLLDVLSGLPTVKIGRAYLCGGAEVEQLPDDWEAVAECTPVYDELPGWSEDISDVRRYEDLPANAKAYVSRIEELTGVPVEIISVGADRTATIVR
ncbi:MAG: adenylosuccinate synthase [Armatimonadota bacterium]